MSFGNSANASRSVCFLFRQRRQYTCNLARMVACTDKSRRQLTLPEVACRKIVAGRYLQAHRLSCYAYRVQYFSLRFSRVDVLAVTNFSRSPDPESIRGDCQHHQWIRCRPHCCGDSLR